MPKALKTLVNEDRLFNVVNRMFTGECTEILSEMIQNSYRANADRVDININDGRISFFDNGQGFVNGLEGFQKLLSIADSHFSPEVEIKQAPMGVGFYALLSHTDVREVRVVSAGLELSIDTSRWFSDSAYRRSWTERVVKVPFEKGTFIEARCQEKFLVDLSRYFQPKWWADSWIKEIPPWAGYGGKIAITFNGRLMPAELPDFLELVPIIETEYLGNRVIIGFRQGYNSQFPRSFVNWFGKIIPTNQIGFGLEFQMTVTVNNPVTPKSPTRAGIVQDEKWKAFCAFLLRTIRNYFEQLTSPPPVRVLEAGFALFHDLQNQLPWIIVRKAVRGSCHDFESRFESCHGEVVEKEGDFYLLDSQIEVFFDDEKSVTCEGLESFLPLLEKPSFFLEKGAAPVLSVGWKPGPIVRDDLSVKVHERGHFALLDGNNEGEWRPVTKDVYAFTRPSAVDIAYCDLLTGTENPISTIREASGPTFEQSSDSGNSWETDNDEFVETVDRFLMKFLGDVIPSNFSQSDLQEFLPDGVRLLRILFKYEKERAVGIKLVFSNRETKELRFY
jgi:hypothetical protein